MTITSDDEGRLAIARNLATAALLVGLRVANPTAVGAVAVAVILDCRRLWLLTVLAYGTLC